ncbi:hypothetical protein ACFL3S_09070 [Gemmatimonadota bacterium]
MALQFEGLKPEEGLSIQRAEELLSSLQGVISVRVVAKPGGVIEEIHLLTTDEVTPKQTVRNVESALRAQFHLEVDHRKISVAQTSDRPAPRKEEVDSKPAVLIERITAPGGSRILFIRHQVETERAQRIRVRVAVEWDGAEHVGQAVGADFYRSRLETIATATLRALEATLNNNGAGAVEHGVTLALEGVKVVEAFDRKYVLVGVSAINDQDMATLSGTKAIQNAPDRAVILATLQAADRWVRGRL